MLFASGLREDYLLNIPFQNSINDVSGNYTMIPGDGSTNAPTFVAGRKGTDYAALFDGTKSIKTNANFVTGTDKVSISLWVKFTATSTGTVIVELGNAAPSASNNLFDVVLRSTDAFTFRAKGGVRYAQIILDTWYHFVLVADLSHPLLGRKILFYRNGQLIGTQEGPINDTGNFANGILHIGQRGGTTLGFNGYIQDLQIYNRALSAGEINRIYNKQK